MKNRRHLRGIQLKNQSQHIDPGPNSVALTAIAPVFTRPWTKNAEDTAGFGKAVRPQKYFLQQERKKKN